jgi:HAMP domain-containing protein
MKILPKLLILLIVVTVVPLGILGYLAVQDSKELSMSVAKDAEIMGNDAIADSTAALTSLGESVIKQKAIDVAKQMEIYIRENPDMTVEMLQADPYFFSMVTQTVGVTGYTCAWDAATSIARFHNSPHLYNVDLHTTAEKTPNLWALVRASEGGKTTYGYYDLEEADGTIKQKYMYILPVNAMTADGILLNLAATTYIDEFNAPAKNTEAKINQAMEDTLARIKTSTEGLSTQNTIVILTIIVIVVVVVVGYFFARTITMPLTKLTRVAKKLSQGDPNIYVPVCTAKDEIRDLSDSIRSAVAAVMVLLEEENQKAGGKK